jgi:xylulokinase
MSIICIAIEQKIDLQPQSLWRDFQLAQAGFRSIEFGNVDRWFPWLRSLQQMKKDLLLAFDVGTSSVRAALVSETGKILAFAAKELEQVIPQFGWSQQSPRSWWEGLVFSVRHVLEKVREGADRVAAIAGCGQMHGVVLINDHGDLVLEEAPIWNDKRTRDLVAQFCAEQDTEALLPIVANPPTVAWPAFKLAWIKQNLPKSYDAARTVLMPKSILSSRASADSISARRRRATFLIFAPVTGA